MCTIALIAPIITMATTQLMLEACRETCCVPVSERDVHAPRMNWVVVTDEDQNRRMRMHWAPSAESR